MAALGERLLAMSGQFEQRRLARPPYQLAVLDAFCGDEQLRRRAEARIAWRELGAARRRIEELTRDAAAGEARLAELRALVEDTEGLEPGLEDALREERERLRHLTELVEGTAAAAEALDPEDGDGRRRARPRRPSGRSRPSSGSRRSSRRRPTSCATPSCGSARRRARSVPSCRCSRPTRAGWSRSSRELDRIADARRRFRCESFEELLARAAEAQTELVALDQGLDPVAGAEQAVARAEPV